LFESDDQLIKIGHGNIDEVEVMKAGNIINFPEPSATERSQKIVCESADLNEDKDLLQLRISGQVIVSIDPDTKEVVE